MKTLAPFIMVALLGFSTGPVLAEEPADKYYAPGEMAASREALRKAVGGQSNIFLMADRLEYRSGDTDTVLWDAQGWFGTDLRKIWIKTEGDYSLDANEFEEVEVQLLYSRAISPFFDLQTGVRQDIEPGPQRTWGVIGIQGLAPYWFEVDAAAFISTEGEYTGSMEVEYEVLLTQRLILQPRSELNFAFQEAEELGLGAGLNSIEAGLRLRYEIRREFAPYLGVAWSRAIGDTADFVRAEGEDVENLSFVFGLRTWF